MRVYPRDRAKHSEWCGIAGLSQNSSGMRDQKRLWRALCKDRTREFQSVSTRALTLISKSVLNQKLMLWSAILLNCLNFAYSNRPTLLFLSAVFSSCTLLKGRLISVEKYYINNSWPIHAESNIWRLFSISLHYIWTGSVLEILSNSALSYP